MMKEHGNEKIPTFRNQPHASHFHIVDNGDNGVRRQQHGD
jgi:hypothetical protein